MPVKISRGNAVVDGQPFRQWFVGPLRDWSQTNSPDLQEADFALRDTNALEIKWGVHPAGQQRSGGWAACSEKISISILLRGDFLLRFRDPQAPAEWVEHRLVQEGDYVIWREEVEHIWIAEKDSVILTVRWGTG